MTEATASLAAMRRFKWLLLTLVAANLVLVNTHQGEFWPFSRYPMFSRTGKPRIRAIVRELRPQDLGRPLGEVGERDLPGVPFPLGGFHIDQDDLNTLVRPLLPGVSSEQASFLARYFAGPLRTRRLVLYAVRNSLDDQTVQVRFRPLAVLGPDGVRGLPQPKDRPWP